jgi:acyl carrier protein
VSPNTPPSPEDDPVLRDALKRCSPATYYAACKFRATGDLAALRAVVLGVIERFVERDLRAKLQGPANDIAALRLADDLALDSLTMMEIVMLAEEVLPLTISNEELTRLRTLGAVQDFIAGKVATAKPAAGVPAPVSDSVPPALAALANQGPTHA